MPTHRQPYTPFPFPISPDATPVEWNNTLDDLLTDRDVLQPFGIAPDQISKIFGRIALRQVAGSYVWVLACAHPKATQGKTKVRVVGGEGSSWRGCVDQAYAYVTLWANGLEETPFTPEALYRTPFPKTPRDD